MQYLIYFAVATPLLLGWLFWTTAGETQPPPMFHSFADTLSEMTMASAKEEYERHQVANQNASLNLIGRQSSTDNTKPL